MAPWRISLGAICFVLLALSQKKRRVIVLVIALTLGSVVMSMRHKTLPIEGVQFHPESVLTEHGHQMLANWLVVCGDLEAPKRAVGLSPVLGNSK